LLDPRGWERSLQGSLSYLFDYDILISDPTLFGQTLSFDPNLTPERYALFSGRPRVAFRQSVLETQIEGELFDAPSGANLISGPVRVTIPSQFLAPRIGTAPSLDILRLLPYDVEKVLFLDTASLALPEDLKEALRTQWKRWEFEPLTEFRTVLASPFCYAQWRGGALLMSGIKWNEGFQSQVESRFPRSVISSKGTWSAGTQVKGFEREHKPAWFVRGDYLVASPKGGVERLAEMLSTRFERAKSFRKTSPLIREMERLSSPEKGWHVCIIERSPKSPIHWILVLTFDRESVGNAHGYLIVELRPDSNRPNPTAKDPSS